MFRHLFSNYFTLERLNFKILFILKVHTLFQYVYGFNVVISLSSHDSDIVMVSVKLFDYYIQLQVRYNDNY